MAVIEVGHPLVRHKLGLMRRQNISTKEFRELASEVARLLTYEATNWKRNGTPFAAGRAGGGGTDQGEEGYHLSHPPGRAGDVGRGARSHSQRQGQRRGHLPG